MKKTAMTLIFIRQSLAGFRLKLLTRSLKVFCLLQAALARIDDLTATNRRAALTLWNDGIVWRGTKYPLEELRKGMV